MYRHGEANVIALHSRFCEYFSQSATDRTRKIRNNPASDVYIFFNSISEKARYISENMNCNSLLKTKVCLFTNLKYKSEVQLRLSEILFTSRNYK
jgi:hypothetical protein